MNHKLSHHWEVTSRREFFTRAGSGLAGIALASLLQQDGKAVSLPPDPLAPKKPHHAPKAKSVIWLFMEGGPSHVDTVRSEAASCNELSGQPMPASFGKPITAMGTASNTLMGIPAQVQAIRPERHLGLGLAAAYGGARGRDVGHPLLLGRRAESRRLGLPDEHRVHPGGTASMGAWVTYGLGSANRNLPTFVILLDDKEPIGGPKNWSAGFLPATYQGTQFRQGDTPILHLKPPAGIDRPSSSAASSIF